MHLSTPKTLNICLALFLSSSVSSPPVAAESKLHVTVSIPPQAYLFDRIGGGALVTEILIPSCRSPATYEPTAKQLVALGKTDIYCKVGHPAFAFEGKHLAPILHQHPEIKIIDMWALSLERTRLDQLARADTERGGLNAAAASHRQLESGSELSTDPHIWLSPRQMLWTAREIERLLSTLAVNHAETFRKNLDSLERDIERLDAEIRTLLEPARQKTFVVQHPAWGHFAAHYDLEQLAIEEQGKEASPVHLISLINRARNDGIRTILVQAANSDRAARIVAKEIDATVVKLDPLAYDWLNELRHTAQLLLADSQHV